MLNKLTALVGEYDMIHPGDQVICAVSGGADSIALLFAMYLLKEKLQIRLAAAHFNHGLRGAESDADEAFVREFCRGYDIPLYVGRAQVQAGKKGLEAAAREARYGFFATLQGKIATAHTADDNAETVLMHLIRGTGLKGLGGIAPVGDGLIRPMLTVTRREVLSFAQEYALRYRTDSSNDSDAFLRNRLRHHVMPLLRSENPRLAENLSAMAFSLRQDEAALTQLSGVGKALPVSRLASMPQALRMRYLQDFLQKNGIREPERRHLQLVENLVFSDNPSARACLPGGMVVSRCYDTLQVLQPATAWEETAVRIPGVTELPQLGLRLVCDDQGPGDYLCPQGAVVLRPRQTGDAIRLIGGTKTLKKLMIDRKIPTARRSRIPVLADEAGILAVYGIGPDQNRLAQADGWYFRFEAYSPEAVRKQEEGENVH